MGRGRVNLTLIENEGIRRSTMKRRRQVLLKKVSELTTLCGLPSLCIIYCPGEPQPLVWPTHDQIRQHLHRYFAVPEVERSKKATSQESFLMDRIAKERENHLKYMKQLKNLRVAVLMNELFYGRGLYGLHFHELDMLVSLLKEKVEEVNKKIKFYEDGSVQPRPSPPHSAEDMEADGGAEEEEEDEVPNQAGVVAQQLQQAQGGSAESVLTQGQQTLNIDVDGSSSSLGYINPIQLGLHSGNQQPLAMHPFGLVASPYGFPDTQQLDFGNTFHGSSYEMSGGNYIDGGANMSQVMAAGGNLVVPSENLETLSLFPGGNNFNPPPIPLSPSDYYGQLSPSPMVVDGGRGDSQVHYDGGHFVEGFFEQGNLESPLVEDWLEPPVQPQEHQHQQQQVEAYDNMGNMVWPPQVNDFPPRE